jgi:hypothetical protein
VADLRKSIAILFTVGLIFTLTATAVSARSLHTEMAVSSHNTQHNTQVINTNNVATGIIYIRGSNINANTGDTNSGNNIDSNNGGKDSIGSASAGGITNIVTSTVTNNVIQW